MKKISILLIALLLVLPAAIAQMGPRGKGYVKGMPVMEDDNDNGIPDGLEDDDGDGIINRDDEDYEKEYKNRENALDDDNDGIPNGQDPDFVPFRNRLDEGDVGFPVTVPGLRNSIQVRLENMERQAAHLSEVKQRIYEKQDRIRGAAHGLMMAANFLQNGTAARRMYQIGFGLNNSIQRTIAAEERITERNWLRRVLVGGDWEAASEIEQEWNQNQERLRELVQLYTDEADEEVRLVLQEQIAQIQEEQQRLRELIIEEYSSRGIFGWAKSMPEPQ